MYKKEWCTRKIVVLGIKPIASLTSSLPSPSSDLKTYSGLYMRKELPCTALESTIIVFRSLLACGYSRLSSPLFHHESRFLIMLGLDGSSKVSSASLFSLRRVMFRLACASTITCTNRIWPDLAFAFVNKRSGYEIISQVLQSTPGNSKPL